MNFYFTKHFRLRQIYTQTYSLSHSSFRCFSRCIIMDCTPTRAKNKNLVEIHQQPTFHANRMGEKKIPLICKPLTLSPSEPIKLSKSLDEFNLKIKNDLNFRLRNFFSNKKNSKKNSYTNNFCVTFSISFEPKPLAMAHNFFSYET